jgi:hypothetical protein
VYAQSLKNLDGARPTGLDGTCLKHVLFCLLNVVDCTDAERVADVAKFGVARGRPPAHSCGH